MTEGRGYLPVSPGSAGQNRLFCFHHAGGAASSFHALRRALAPAVDVLPVQLPGRERRIRETPFTDIEALIDDLEPALAPELYGRYAFYGHSMGALVAHDLIRRLRSRGAVLPTALVAGACPAPHLQLAVTAFAELPDHRLRSWMVELGGMSDQLLAYPEWAEAATSLLRADLQVCLSRNPQDDDPLPVPIHVLAGTDDPLTRDSEVASWASHSSVGCEVIPVVGGHFFNRESPVLFHDLLASVLERAL